MGLGTFLMKDGPLYYWPMGNDVLREGILAGVTGATEPTPLCITDFLEANISEDVIVEVEAPLAPSLITLV